MDPNATLREIRELSERVSEWPKESLADELIEKFDALDAWLQSGGFLPDAWRMAKHP